MNKPTDQKTIKSALVENIYSYIRSRVPNLIYKNIRLISPLLFDTETDLLIKTSDRLINIIVIDPKTSVDSILLEDELVRLSKQTNLHHHFSVGDSLKLVVNGFSKDVPVKKTLKLDTVVIYPTIGFTPKFPPLPENLSGRFFELNHFLAIVDELNDFTAFFEFLDYFDSQDNSFGLSNPLDKFSAFLDSYRNITPGAANYNYVMLDPHWGSNKRYKTLNEFYSRVPEIGCHDSRLFRFKSLYKNIVRVDKRSDSSLPEFVVLMSSIRIHIKSFDKPLEFDQIRISHFLINILCYYFNALEKYLETLQVKYSHCQIKVTEGRPVTPWSVRQGNDFQVFIEYNLEMILRDFEVGSKSSLELDFVQDVAAFLFHGVDELSQHLEDNDKQLPKFVLETKEKLASFPQFHPIIEPDISDYKAARKRAAEIIKDLNIYPRNYSKTDAKEVINQIISSLSSEVSREINSLSFEESISIIVSYHDSLINKNYLDEGQILLSANFKVEYDPVETLYDTREKFIKTARNYRFLIEKLLQLSPTGNEIISSKKLKYLLAFIDWFYVFQSSSDVIHYSLTEVNLNLSDDFVPEVIYSSEEEQKMKSFGLNRASELVEKNYSELSIELDVPYFNELDQVFLSCFGFEFTFFRDVLLLMARWSEFYGGNDKPVYVVEKSVFKDTVIKSLESGISDKIEKIVNFLTLDSDQILKIIGQDSPALELPVWEHRKRPFRYILRPLIESRDSYIWGPYSTFTTCRIWTDNLMSAWLPADFECGVLSKFSETQKLTLEKRIVSEAETIFKDNEYYTVKDRFLHKIDKKGNHPRELGDYDLIAYDNTKNVIFLVECKYYTRPHCLKDVSRFVTKVLGTDGKKSDVSKIKTRHTYFQQNVDQILSALKWPCNSPISVKSIHLSNFLLPYTEFAKTDFDLNFLSINNLLSYLENYNSSISSNS